MKKSILQYAIQGKLVEQRPEEGTGEELYRQIQYEKQRLIKEGKIKKEKPLPEIAEDETPFDIPESWKWVRLNTIGITQTGNTPSKSHLEYIGIDIPFITPGDILNGQICYCTSNSFETRQDHFVCSTSRKKGKEVCDTHFIRAVVLEEGTLQHMRLVIQCVADYEDAFRRALGAKRSDEVRKELSAKKRTLQKSENRLAELDRLFKRIYEDMVNGKLSEARFQMLSDDYEQEQADLRAKIEMLENEIQNQEDQAENVDRFIRQAKKYLYLEKLTPTILNDMVNAVYVHAPDKSSGHRVQDVTISYNYIGILPANLLYDVMNGKAA